MPSEPTPARRQDRTSKFERALKYMREEGVSLSRAGAAFGVAKTCLHRRATGEVAIDAHKGRHATLSTRDEASIIEVILLRSKHGLCVTDNELRILVRRVAIEKHESVPASFPSKKWSLRLVARHRDVITRKRSQILDAKRFDMSTEERIRDYHDNLQDAMKGLDAAQVWNRQKVEDRAVKARERQEKREMREQAAILKQFEKKRKQQERIKKQTTKIPTSTRSRSRKGIRRPQEQVTESTNPLGVAPPNFGQAYDVYVAPYCSDEVRCRVPPAVTRI